MTTPDAAAPDTGSTGTVLTGTVLTGDAAQVWAAMNAVYAAFLASDPDGADAHLHPDVTIWDSARPQMAHGLAGLRALRAERPPGPPSVAAIEASDPVVEVWGDTALVRHLLRVRFVDPAARDELVRNTSVWRRVDGRWLAVHNHEDVLPPA